MQWVVKRVWKDEDFLKYNHLRQYLIEKGSDIKRNKQYTSVHCKKVAGVINCNYGEKTGLVEKILILDPIIDIIKNNFLDTI